MTEGTRQIFSTGSPSRWQRFKWSFRFLLFVMLILFSVLIAALWNIYNPAIPQLKRESDSYKMILNPDKNAFLQETKINKEYAGFRKYINAKGKGNNIKYVSKSDTFIHSYLPIRAAFYDPSDEQSYLSLKNNIAKVNMVLPEFMYIDTTADTVYVNAGFRGADIIKASGVKVVAMLSNFYGDDFNGAPLHRILNDPSKKARLIDDVVRIIQTNHFAGVNVDFEEITEQTDEPFINFMKDLYEKMHPLGLLVTQDIAAFNNDYDAKRLSAFNDYLFLMAYDQFSEGSAPGTISGQKWIEAALDNIGKNVPADKIVLCIAGYGYDWPKDAKAETVSYEEALSIAADKKVKIYFNNDTYNLNYNYVGDEGVPHTVYFTDAATNFNTMRFAADYGVAGVSLWRLGSEDSRLWKFYNKDMSTAGLSHFNFDSLQYIEAANSVDYIGEGEILDVISTPKEGYIKAELDSSELLISEENYISAPSIFIMKKFGKKAGKVVLSFDDGPDIKYTPRILEIINREHVPAVFFMVGINMENNIPLVKRIFNEGYEIGNHTFTHPNMATISRQRAVLEMSTTRLLLESITGHSTTLLRPPYNADAEPETMQELIPVALAKQYNYLTVGESIDPNDWEQGITADSIFSRVVQQENLGSIILLHDAGGNREATIQALPRIIKHFKDKGYIFTTVSDLVGEKKETLMPAVPANAGYHLIQMNYYLAEIGFWSSQILYRLFIVCIILSLLRILFFGYLATIEYLKTKRGTDQPPLFSPLVSIVVPAYNEEVNAVSAVRNLLKLDYPNFNIIFVDDGSTDDTYKKVTLAFESEPKVTITTKKNEGKASALNHGITLSNGEYVLCIDADTQLLADALRQMIQHFTDAKVGAVAGNVKVGNEVNLITRWQSIEYITSQNFDRNAYAHINAITVVPGAIGLFLKSAINEAGNFTSDTFAEDCDLTIRILRAGYKVKNENKAIAFTEAPETLRMFLKQRFRWSFGVMQSFWKNRDALFNSSYGSLGWVALPNILIFQILIPLISPFADVLMLIGIFTGNARLILAYYLLFVLVDTGVAILAFVFEQEKLSKLFWLLPQRLAYRWLMLYVLYKAIRRAVKGELQTWGVLKRTGNIKENPRLRSFEI
jgi:cellulose synthase/poly-beta-1,6-N-acetylglucosamine synthase-like glycosyltransferase/spore germination protein YaaH/peptidoglycan/xylan/chitin deacetylase (PgdA/CDA1 family)